MQESFNAFNRKNTELVGSANHNTYVCTLVHGCHSREFDNPSCEHKEITREIWSFLMMFYQNSGISRTSIFRGL